MRFRAAMILAACASLLVVGPDFVGAIESSPKDSDVDLFQQPLLFEPNHGQADSSVEFLARSGGLVVELAKQGVRIRFRSEDGCESEVEISLDGSRTDVVLQGLRSAEARVNYFIGNNPINWQTNLPTYGAVSYKDVYSGIDWIFYERDGLLEHDFVVSPGADASQIQLQINGVNQTHIDTRGNLVLTTEAGSLEMLAPIAFQESQNIESKYRLASDSRVGFELGPYDPEKPLIIDPQISYGSFLGGATFDNANDVAVDNKGNFYVVGYTEANTRIPGYGDGFIYKFNSSGAVVWSAFLIGSFGDVASAIAVAPNGTAYIVGSTDSRDFPIVAGFQTRNAGLLDAFVVKLAVNGSTIIRSSYLGGSGNDSATGIEIGTGPKLRNGLYITGNTNSRNFPLKNATQNQFGGGTKDGFLAIVHSIQFTNLMSTYVGLDGSDDITSLALNTARGDLYATVLSLDTSDGGYVAHFRPKQGSNSPNVGIDYETYVEYLDNSYGARFAYKWMLAFRRFAGSAPLQPGASPTIMIALSSCLPQAPATSCSDNGVLLSLDQDLNPLGAVNFGGQGPGAHFINDIAVSRSGTIYMVGDTLIKNLPLVNAFQTQHKGGWEGFVIALAPGTNQTTLYSYLGGTGFDFASAVAVDSTGNIFVVGQTSSKKFPTTPNGLKRTLGGTADGFVVKITP